MTHIDYAMSNEDYHDKDKHPHISSTDIKTVEKTSPLHWALKQSLPKKKPTPAMLMGSAVHAMISEPDKALFVRGLPNRLKRKKSLLLLVIESISPFNVIGRALESSSDTGIKLVNCAVRTNN